MSEADKMFEELGYVIGYTQVGYLKYAKNEDNIIIFNDDNKTFYKRGEDDYEQYYDNFTMQELKAINQKCKEMRVVRWIIIVH